MSRKIGAFAASTARAVDLDRNADVQRLVPGVHRMSHVRDRRVVAVLYGPCAVTGPGHGLRLSRVLGRVEDQRVGPTARAHRPRAAGTASCRCLAVAGGQNRHNRSHGECLEQCPALHGFSSPSRRPGRRSTDCLHISSASSKYVLCASDAPPLNRRQLGRPEPSTDQSGGREKTDRARSERMPLWSSLASMLIKARSCALSPKFYSRQVAAVTPQRR
jgi:hypothetical protein